eukprot:2910408-Pyramimonas_sp.AAC.1
MPREKEAQAKAPPQAMPGPLAWGGAPSDRPERKARLAVHAADDAANRIHEKEVRTFLVDAERHGP